MVPWPITLLLLFLVLVALVSGYVMGMVAGYTAGARDGLQTGATQYQAASCQEYPFTLLDPKQFRACRKKSEKSHLPLWREFLVKSVELNMERHGR